MLTSGTMPEYLFRCTAGVVGLLERLIEDGCAEALDTGEEQLTERLLDSVTVNPSGDPSRDASAGEIPSLPPPSADHAPRQPSKRRGRNTVFDDRGVPATATDRSA